ncbi:MULTISPECIES: hypothetical protein [Bacillus]|uniref:hypothetical protein n=1 Tax=Bacillus TaxID=1386 RepID=UPI00031057AF|nr:MULTISPECIES: hypothetical protein [Bacillus]
MKALNIEKKIIENALTDDSMLGEIAKKVMNDLEDNQIIPSYHVLTPELKEEYQKSVDIFNKLLEMVTIHTGGKDLLIDYEDSNATIQGQFADAYFVLGFTLGAKYLDKLNNDLKG